MSRAQDQFWNFSNLTIEYIFFIIWFNDNIIHIFRIRSSLIDFLWDKVENTVVENFIIFQINTGFSEIFELKYFTFWFKEPCVQTGCYQKNCCKFNRSDCYCDEWEETNSHLIPSLFLCSEPIVFVKTYSSRNHISRMCHLDIAFCILIYHFQIYFKK